LDQRLTPNQSAFQREKRQWRGGRREVTSRLQQGKARSAGRIARVGWKMEFLVDLDAGGWVGRPRPCVLAPHARLDHSALASTRPRRVRAAILGAPPTPLFFGQFARRSLMEGSAAPGDGWLCVWTRVGVNRWLSLCAFHRIRVMSIATHDTRQIGLEKRRSPCQRVSASYVRCRLLLRPVCERYCLFFCAALRNMAATCS